MSFVLSSQNVLSYLIENKICHPQVQISQTKQKNSKNFNLLVELTNGSNLLVKQQNRNSDGKAREGFFDEWRIHQLVQEFSELKYLRSRTTELLHFDAEQSIIVFNYLTDYGDIADFYDRQKIFPTAIAAAIGDNLALIHRSTLDCQQYRDFLAQKCQGTPIARVPNFLRGLARIEPEIFGTIAFESLQFFQLYQLYESLEKAIADLNAAFVPCCLTHNDLKLDNILLHQEWKQIKTENSNNPAIRLIDWEHSNWGEPAFDLGTVIASYLKIWLSSIAIGTDINVQTALHLAVTPLEQLQPSLIAFTQAYLNCFPEILARRPDFLLRVMQFAGLALIRRIQAKLEYRGSFDNTGICMLQVAKTLLCRPQESILVIFGIQATELSRLHQTPSWIC